MSIVLAEGKDVTKRIVSDRKFAILNLAGNIPIVRIGCAMQLPTYGIWPRHYTNESKVLPSTI